MKVLFLLIHFPKLSETFILNQVTGLIDRGLDVEILARKDNNEQLLHSDVVNYSLVENHTKYYDQPLSLAGNITRAVKNIVHLKSDYYKHIIYAADSKPIVNINLISNYSLFNKEFDIIHVHFGYNTYPGISLKSSGVFNGKLVTSFHGNDLSKYTFNKDNPYKQLIKWGDSFLPVSNYLSDRLIKLGFPKDKIKVHRVGIDFQKFKYKKRSNNIKIKLLSIGRLIEKKGFEIAIRSISELISENRDINITYNIVGSGELKAKLDTIIKDNGMHKHIKILGDKTHHEVMELLYESDIFLSPSIVAEDGDIEGIPTVLMEAMSTGLPVISTFHSGIPELIKNNTDGLLCGEKDQKGLKENILYLIKNYDKRVILAENARKTVEIKHNINRLNDDLVKHYNSILNK